MAPGLRVLFLTACALCALSQAIPNRSRADEPEEAERTAVRCDGIGQEVEMEWTGRLRLHSGLLKAEPDPDPLVRLAVLEQLRSWSGAINHRLYNHELHGLAPRPDTLKLEIASRRKGIYSEEMEIRSPTLPSDGLPGYTRRAIALGRIRASDPAEVLEYRAKARAIACTRAKKPRLEVLLPLPLDPFLIFWASLRSTVPASLCVAGSAGRVTDPAAFLSAWDPYHYRLSQSGQFVDCERELSRSLMTVRVGISPSHWNRTPNDSEILGIPVLRKRSESRILLLFSTASSDELRTFPSQLPEAGFPPLKTESSDPGTRAFLDTVMGVLGHYPRREIRVTREGRTLIVSVSPTGKVSSPVREIELRIGDWSGGIERQGLLKALKTRNLIIDTGSVLGHIPKRSASGPDDGLHDRVVALLFSSSYGSESAARLRGGALSGRLKLLSIGQRHDFHFFEFGAMLKALERSGSSPRNSAPASESSPMDGNLGRLYSLFAAPPRIEARPPVLLVLERVPDSTRAGSISR